MPWASGPNDPAIATAQSHTVGLERKDFMPRKSSLALVGVAASYLTLHWLGRTWGASKHERARSLPGDEIVPKPQILTTHATTIEAPPWAVWPWLIQMGWHQGGWYTSHWVDQLLFPANWPAATAILPELQHRVVGDFIPDGPPESECGFIIEHLETDRSLVLHSTTHMPKTWRERYGARLDWTWSFLIVDMGGNRSRLIFRCRGNAEPWWLLALYRLAIVPADFIMSRQMLSGIRRRVLATDSAAFAFSTSRQR